ncbi:MAG: CoA transferase [SAR202 cluster bacterium]|nr:CoA transferase [SAR202 cluster bacterium]
MSPLGDAKEGRGGMRLDTALQGVKVLDLTWHIAGPYCSKLLADFGADVIKVERPATGDPARAIGPFLNDEPHLEKSGLFLHLNTNKRSVTLDLKHPHARDITQGLVEWADIVVENFSPRVLPLLGLSYQTLASWNPRVLLVSISNFGQTGPYRDYRAEDLTIYAMGGPMLMTGTPELPPSRLGLNVVLYQGGAAAALATVTALVGAELRGRGEHVDVSLYETQMGTQDRRVSGLVGYQYTGTTFTRRPAGAGIASGVKPCKDGYINLVGAGVRFSRIVTMLGKPEILKDPRFATPEARTLPENVQAFEEEYVLPWLSERTMEEAWAAAQAVGVLSGPVFTVRDIVEREHFVGRGAFAALDHPVAGRLMYPSRPFIMMETPSLLEQRPGSPVCRPAPLLGQHNREVYHGLLGLSQSELDALSAAGVI